MRLAGLSPRTDSRKRAIYDEEFTLAKSDFAWTFPCCILARDHQIDSQTGHVILDSSTSIIAPEVAADGEKHMAIFTDPDLADRFRESVPMAADTERVDFQTPMSLRVLLLAVQDQFRFAAIDLNPRTRVCRSFLIAEMLPALDRWAAEFEE